MADPIGFDGSFYWFVGIIEDIDDPLQNGRVKVRVISYYNPSLTEYVETDDIPWCMPLTPITSASRFGVGLSPVGVLPGSYAFGFYIDGEKRTKPFLIGTWPVYDEDPSKNSVSKIARGFGPVEKEYLDVEPESQYKSEYPWNKTTTTVRGHVIEIDDTPEAERIHIFHRGGTYIEMNQDGSLVIKTKADNYDIVEGNQTIHIEGDQDVTIKGNQTVLIEGNQDVTIKGDQTLLVEGDQNATIEGNQTLNVKGNQDVTVNGSQSIIVDGDVNYTVSGTTTIDCSDVTITGDLTVNGNIKGGKITTEGGVDLDTHTHSNSGSGPPN